MILAVEKLLLIYIEGLNVFYVQFHICGALRDLVLFVQF